VKASPNRPGKEISREKALCSFDYDPVVTILEQTGHQQLTISIFLSEQTSTSTSHQPNEQI
jgi:hypothetical protein